MVGAEIMSIWKTSCWQEEKPWGKLEKWSAPWGVQGKIIYLKADKRTSLKYYLHKREALYCLSGRAVVYAPEEFEFGDKKLTSGAEFYLEPGDVLMVQPNNPYRIKAYEDCVLVEVTFGGGNEGVIMMEDDFGRAKISKITK